MWRTDISPGLWLKDIHRVLNSYGRKWVQPSAGFHLKNCCSSDVPIAAREPYIVSGYRPIGTSINNCVYSAFKLHNETINFWTHFVAAIYFLSVFHTDMQNSWHSTERFIQLMPCFAFAFSLSVCFSLSAIAHIFCSVSVEGRKALFVLDYAGVGANALGAAICYTAYIPESWLPFGNRNAYSVMVVVFVSLAAAGCSVAMVYWSDWPAGQGLKAASFGSIALQGNIPLMWYLLALWKTDPEIAYNIGAHFWSYATLKLVAGFFLASCIPERFFSKTFDLLGHSHQIFHVASFFCVRSQYRLALALATVNVDPNVNAVWWRTFLTLTTGYLGLCLTAAFFIKEIYRLKETKGGLKSH